jgi:hypothetical protein
MARMKEGGPSNVKHAASSLPSNTPPEGTSHAPGMEAKYGGGGNPSEFSRSHTPHENSGHSGATHEFWKAHGDKTGTHENAEGDGECGPPPISFGE